MPDRHMPVRPDLNALDQQARDLLAQLRRADPNALDLFARHQPHTPPASASLDHARHAIARAYGLPDWNRLTLACQLTDAIARDDLDLAKSLITAHPNLLHEDARGVPGNWGPPMSYAANLGRIRLVDLFHSLGAPDLQHAFQRACLQSQLPTARRLHQLGAYPAPGSVMGPCETLSDLGLAFLLDLGAKPADEHGDPLAPLALVLQTYCRNPDGKHRCLELLAHYVHLPDTAPMAVHRGRLDLLQACLQRDPDLLNRTFSHDEIYPRTLGCADDHSLALHGTPLDGGTLLHLCVDFDELPLAQWLLDHGADVNAPAAVDPDGFGGHTPLFGCVVSQPYRVGRRRDDAFARLLLDRGASTTIRASLRKRLRFVTDESLHEYPDVTPLDWGRRFHDQDWVNPAVMDLLTPRA